MQLLCSAVCAEYSICMGAGLLDAWINAVKMKVGSADYTHCIHLVTCLWDDCYRKISLRLMDCGRMFLSLLVVASLNALLLPYLAASTQADAR